MRTEVGSGGEQLLAYKDNILADNSKRSRRASPGVDGEESNWRISERRQSSKRYMRRTVECQIQKKWHLWLNPLWYWVFNSPAFMLGKFKVCAIQTVDPRNWVCFICTIPFFHALNYPAHGRFDLLQTYQMRRFCLSWWTPGNTHCIRSPGVIHI